jgi:hypothetical protein
VQRIARKTSTLLALLGAALASCGDGDETTTAPPRPAVMLSVWTNMSVPSDIDEIHITVQQEGAEGLAFEDTLDLRVTSRDQSLPAQLAIFPGEQKRPRVTFTVDGTHEGSLVAHWTKTLTLPENWQQVLEKELTAQTASPSPMSRPLTSTPTGSEPPNYVVPPMARVDMKADGVCVEGGRSECGTAQTCVRGICVSNDLDFTKLPLVEETPHGSGGAGGKSCFDVDECFAESTPLVQEVEGCSFENPEGTGALNVALALPAGGIGFCDASRCLLPLDEGAAFDFVEEGQRIVLQPDLCTLLSSEAVRNVIASRSACKTKTPSDTLCAQGGEGGGSGAGGGGAGGAAGGTGGSGGAGAGSGGIDPDGPVATMQPPYVVPVENGVVVRALLTVGDPASSDVPPYSFEESPAGIGVVDNGDDTYTLLVSHDLSGEESSVRAHGAGGAFVSRFSVSELLVGGGSDLGERAMLWNPGESWYDPPEAVTFEYLHSGVVADGAALYDAASGMGYDGALYLNGEQTSAEGRALAFGLDGDIWDLPALGKMPFGSVVAHPATGETTVVAVTSYAPGGYVYFHFGTKSDTGTPVEMAGLSGGRLYGLRVDGYLDEGEVGIPSASFDLADLGDVTNSAAAQIEGAAVMQSATKFELPAGGAWEPVRGAYFYFVTTTSPDVGRLWRLRFESPADPLAGGVLEMLLDGSEGQRQLDGLAVDARGYVYLAERPGGDPRLSRILRYDILYDTLIAVAEADPARFGDAGSSTSENIFGITDASNVLGPGWLLFTLQDQSVQSGQLLALYDPVSP